MCKLPIVKAKEHNSNYTTIKNDIFKENGLSLKAKGLLSYAISLKGDWKFSKRGIMTSCTDKEASIETALRELEEHFYLKRKRIRNKGKFNTLYTFYEVPYNRQTNSEKTIRLKTRGRQSVRIKRVQ